MDKKAVVQLSLPAKTPTTLVIKAQAFIGSSKTDQIVEIKVNGVPQKPALLTQRFGNVIEIPLNQSVLNANQLKVEFGFPTAASPKALGIGIDERPLAIGLESVRYQ